MENKSTRSFSALLIVMFVAALVIPAVFSVGPLRLSLYRLLLIIATLPAVFMLFSGRYGRVRTPDIAMLFLCLWASLSMAVVDGLPGSIEPIGIFFVETFGVYALARVAIRDAGHFRLFSKALFWSVMFLAPFAVYENLTDHTVLLDFFRSILGSYPNVRHEMRLGLHRAQVAFPHQILLGVYANSAVAMTYYVVFFRSSFPVRGMTVLAVILVGFTSLSSGPITSMVAQMMIISWDIAFRSVRQRWWIMCGLAAAAWVAVDMVSSRSPPEVFISYLALNSGTAYARIMIWEYGSQAILNYPLLGHGLITHTWERPAWMGDSIDMFWLVIPIRYGLPAIMAMAIALFSMVWAVVHCRGLDRTERVYRVGYIGALFGFFMAGWTVHFWDQTYVLLLFFLGAGAWFPDAARRNRRSAMLAAERNPSDGRQPLPPEPTAYPDVGTVRPANSGAAHARGVASGADALHPDESSTKQTSGSKTPRVRTWP